MKSILEAVYQHAQQRPDEPAILFAEQNILYSLLFSQIERFAQALTSWSLQRGDRIALFLENCPEFVSSYLGIQLAGGIVVLVNTQYRLALFDGYGCPVLAAHRNQIPDSSRC